MRGNSWRCSLSHNAAPPEEVPYPFCTQGENSWHSLHLEIRILSSVRLDFHNLRPEGLEVHHTHLGAPLGSRLALEVHMKAEEVYMKAEEVHMKAEEDHMKAEEQNMLAGRMVYWGNCRMVWEHGRRASEHHKLVCNLDTRVSQAPPLCLCYGGFSM